MFTRSRSARRRGPARLAAAVGAAGLFGATALSIGLPVLTASAAFESLPYETSFEVDGDAAPTTGQDWNTPAADAPNLQDPVASETGVGAWGTLETCNNNPQTIDDPDNPGTPIEVTDELTRVPPGSKLDDLELSSLIIQAGNVPRKADLCAVYRSWELVFVPDAGSLDPSAGQYQFIFYGGWSRPNVNGEIDVLFPLLGPDNTSKDDDLIISYDFTDSTDGTIVTVLDWNGSAWVPLTLPAEVFEGVTTRAVERHPTSGEFLTFGEFAINLTVAGILPENGPCVSLSAGNPMSRTGNSANASMEDVVAMPPVTLTNCGILTVNKTTRPAAPSPAQGFPITTSELDGAPIQFGDPSPVTSIDGTLTVPGAATVTYLDLLISPDYQVVEGQLPEGWTEESLVCTSYDPIAGVDVTRSLWPQGDGADTSFPIAPGVEAVCEIVNVGPPTITIYKTTVGGVGGPFTISATPVEGDPLDFQATTEVADTPTLAGSTTTVPAGTYTIQEVGAPTAWTPDGLTCDLTTGEGTVAAGSASGSGPVEVAVGPGEALVCTQTNLAPGSVDVTKTVDGTSTDWSFSFTISPVPDGETATKPVDAQNPVAHWDHLIPGTSYTVTEVGAGGDNYIHGSVDCGDGGSFTVDPGEAASCAVTNVELASVDVTKSVQGLSTDWSFAFTISPVPAGETATKSATAAAPTVGWDGLTPGRAYTVTEAAVDGYQSGAIDCGEGATFTPTAGEAVTCAVTNVELASVSVTKSVVPAGETGWSYGFTISPVPSGETGTKTATSGAPTVGWAGLVPGTQYTVSEVSETDLVIGTMTCTGGTNTAGASTFTPTAGQDVNCTISNTRIADIAVTKTASPTSVLVGGSVTWTIVVSNAGPSTALQVKLVDALPSTLTLVSYQAPSTWDCSATVVGAPGTLSCTKPAMLPSESWSFRVVTTVNAAPGTTIQNTAVVSTTTDEVTTTNNRDSAAASVEQVASLPPTGNEARQLAQLASLLLAAGAGLLLIRRRRTADA